jgi:CubicO group peptidase (beta-lactamase class C family)
MTAALDGLVQAGELAGAVALAWRDGAVTGCAAAGWRDLEAGAPMTRDAIFRIASLSKPITSTAALMLYDEGRFALEDPIAELAPEFARMRVLRDPDGPLDDTEPAARPITFGDLLTHRAGFTYGGFHPGPIGQAYAQALGADLDSGLTPDEWLARLAELPLIDQPGQGFHYGASVDVLGFLVARLEGAPLGEVLARRIFRPLGMADTGFTVADDKRGRVAKMYGFDAAGRLEHRPAHPPEAPAFFAERPEGATYVSGGAGLWSTADDYLAFARMFVEEGAVGGVRLLKISTLRRMTANFLTEDQRAAARMMGASPFAGHGFGLGVAVVVDPERAQVVRGKGGAGTVSWPGAYGGWWQADPTDGSVIVFLAHNAMDLARLADGVGLGVYAAIEQVHALATAPPARERAH